MFKRLFAFLGFIPYEHEKQETTRKSFEFPSAYFEEKQEEIVVQKPRLKYWEMIGDRASLLEHYDNNVKKKLYKKQQDAMDKKCDTRVSSFHSTTHNSIVKIQKIEKWERAKNFMQQQDETIWKVRKEIMWKSMEYFTS